MLKVTIKHSGVNESFRIGYFLEAIGMVRTDNCYSTEIYQGKNPESKTVYAVLNVCHKESPTPMMEWQGKLLEFMGLSIITTPTDNDFKHCHDVALVSENCILHIEKEGLSKAFDQWHELKKHIPDISIVVLMRNGENVKKSGKVTLYTVDYNTIGNCNIGRRFFTSLQKAREFSENPLRDKPIKRTYTYTHAKQIIEEQDEIDALAQRWCYLPDYE